MKSTALAMEVKTSPNYVLRCGKQVLSLNQRTHIMGILNVTPDSFYDGGKYNNSLDAVQQAINLEHAGADILDIGGESTRPGAESITVKEEIDRVVPVIEKLKGKIKQALISIDTRKSQVAQAALECGAHIVNDISGLCYDKKMKDVVAQNNAIVIIMHSKGTPKIMQKQPFYDDLIGDIYTFLYNGINKAIKAGVLKDNIVIDPGIGFGKTREHNLELINRLGDFSGLGVPIAIGPSRKSFIGLTLNLPPEERLEGTLAAVSVGVSNGAHIVRVHDVCAAKRAVMIVDAIKTTSID